MPRWDTGKIISDAVECTINAPIIGWVVNNAIATSLLLTAVIAVIAMSLYCNVIEHGGVNKALKGCLYVFLAAIAILYTHYYARKRTIMHDVAQSKRAQNMSELMRYRPAQEPVSYLTGPYDGMDAPNQQYVAPTKELLATQQLNEVPVQGKGSLYQPDAASSSSRQSEFVPVQITGQMR